MLDCPRVSYKFANDVMLSVVHLFPGEEHPIEVLIVGGPDEALETLEWQAFPVSDPFRFNAAELAHFINVLTTACGGVKGIAFDRKELTDV